MSGTPVGNCHAPTPTRSASEIKWSAHRTDLITEQYQQRVAQGGQSALPRLKKRDLDSTVPRLHFRKPQDGTPLADPGDPVLREENTSQPRMSV